jgi:hypothetical protein
MWFSSYAGTQTAAVVLLVDAPSGDPSATEEYDGTSWSGGGTFPSTGAIFNGMVQDSNSWISWWIMLQLQHQLMNMMELLGQLEEV